MIRFKDIHIPKPCSVDYDSLPGNEVKRLCGSCEKHVYDFRGKDEAYLNEVYQRTGMVCGIYYEDQIQRPSLKIQRSFYRTLLTKIIGIGLFIKTVISSYEAEAATLSPYQISQVSEDSVGVKVKFKDRPTVSSYYNISIYINDTLYKYHINADKGFIYLPDTIKVTDKIKVIVNRTSPSRYKHISNVVKHKEYNFRLSESDWMTVLVNYNKKFTLFRRRQVVGVSSSEDFW
jgi:hypothetical protein